MTRRLCSSRTSKPPKPSPTPDPTSAWSTPPACPVTQRLRTSALLADVAPLTIVATDADLGGIRIAEQLLSVAPRARLLDVGTVPHDPPRKWPPANGYRRAIERAVDGPAASLAKPVLARGYSLEQELLILAAVVERIVDRTRSGRRDEHLLNRRSPNLSSNETTDQEVNVPQASVEVETLSRLRALCRAVFVPVRLRRAGLRSP
jgi:hypothetical protein